MKEPITKKIFLTCECGAHVMQVICDSEYKDKDKYYQEWDFAMFNYAGLGKPTIWHRIKVAWQYLTTGSMHDDEIVLNEKEAEKLANFINENNYGKILKND